MNLIQKLFTGMTHNIKTKDHCTLFYLFMALFVPSIVPTLILLLLNKSISLHHYINHLTALYVLLFFSLAACRSFYTYYSLIEENQSAANWFKKHSSDAIMSALGALILLEAYFNYGANKLSAVLAAIILTLQIVKIAKHSRSFKQEHN